MGQASIRLGTMWLPPNTDLKGSKVIIKPRLLRIYKFIKCNVLEIPSKNIYSHTMLGQNNPAKQLPNLCYGM